MNRVCKIVIVCEGWRDSAFARGFLTAAGIDSRAIDPRVNPGGSGHDWVKTQFVGEVANLARFSEGRGVLGLLDEDGQGVAAREREVAERLEMRGLLPMAAQEGRCLLLPARNIETWLYWLACRRGGVVAAVDEITDYKRQGPPAGISQLSDADCRPAGQHLHKLNHKDLPADCPPMLKTGLGQLREFLRAVSR